MASGQRGANGHPGGSAASGGGAPGIGTRLRGAFRHVADRWPVRCAPRRQWGSNVHGTNPAGRVCLLLHLTPVDEGHADGPVAHLQVARETRLTPTAASCPARCRCVPRTSRGRAVRARDREVPLRYSSPMWTGSVPAARPPHIKAHSGSDGGSAGTAWPTTRNTLVDAGVIDADACPAMSVATPTWGRTPTSRTTASDPGSQSAAPAKQIIEHKQHMRERFPDTALADLALLP